MFETSRDILNIVAAVSIAVFVFFTAWALYQFTNILKQINQLIAEAQAGLRQVESVLSAIRDRIQNTGTHLSMIAKAVSGLVSYINTKREKKKSEKK